MFSNFLKIPPHHSSSSWLSIPRRKASSNSAKYRSSNVRQEQAQTPPQLLADRILFSIFDYIENPFELLRLRRVNKTTKQYVQAKIKLVSELDVRKVCFDTLSSRSTASFTSINQQQQQQQQTDSTVIIGGEVWYVHPSGCKVLCRVCPVDNIVHTSPINKEDQEKNGQHQEEFRLEVLVDEQWTSREITVLCSLVNVFRHDVRHISLDAPIFELIVANLAAVDLERWFAFQCFVKAVDGFQTNMSLNKLAARLQQQEEMDSQANESDPDSLYWPKAKTLLIRTNESESIHLARVLNYGVRSNLVIDRRRLDQLSLHVSVAMSSLSVSKSLPTLSPSSRNNSSLCAAQRPKELVRNLYHFRCWAGSPGFDERFQQQWHVGNREAMASRVA